MSQRNREETPPAFVPTYVRHKSSEMNVRCKLVAISAAIASILSHIVRLIGKENDTWPRRRQRIASSRDSYYIFILSFLSTSQTIYSQEFIETYRWTT